MMRPERTDLAPQVVKAFLGALSLIVALEFLAFYGYRQDPRERLEFGYAEDTGFKVLRDGRLEIRRMASRALWDQNYTARKPAGVTRVMIVGDSVIRGGSYEQSVAGLLRRKLEQCGIAAEVWNLASPGYGARRKDVMVRKALQFEPDLLVYHVNVTTEYEDEREWERRERYASWHPGQWPDKLPLVGRIALSMIEKIYWRWLHPDIRAAFEAKGAEAGEAIRSKSDLEHWMPRMLATFEKTLETVQQAGVPLLVLTRANLDAEGKEMTDLGLDDEMKRLAARRPFAWLSTRAIFAGANPGAFFWDGSHWTPQGHDRAADALLPQALALLAAKAGAPAAKDCPAARR